MRGWVLIIGWAIALLVLRRQLRSDTRHPVNNVEGDTAATEDRVMVGAELDKLISHVSHLAKESLNTQQMVASALGLNAEVLDIKGALSSVLRADASSRGEGGGDQVVHASDAFFVHRVSGVPPIVDDRMFCDQLLNTFHTFFGGDVSKDVVGVWCHGGALAAEAPEHLPPGVEDRHLVFFTLVQVHRKLYLLAQFEDRIDRYRELFQPMINAIEKRHDRMLYNYI